MHLTATLDGRTGSFVLSGEGAFDGKAASATSTIVTGSGTDSLIGISGTVSSVSTHEDYPFMPLILSYDLT